MTMTMTSEKLTLQVAAKALDISVRTIQRYLDKGLLTKIKEDDKVYVYADEIRGLKQKRGMTKQTTDDKATTPKMTVTLDMSYLEGLLVQLGQLKEKQQLLLEYKDDIRQRNDTLLSKERELIEQKAIIEKKNKEITELKNIAKRAEDLEAEIARLKNRSWWQKIFSRG